MRIASFMCAAALFLGCGESPRYYVRPSPEPHSLIARIWVQDDPLLSKRAALAGCRFWDDKGVLCALAPSPEQADLRVVADPVACGQGDSVIEPTQAAGEGAGKPGGVGDGDAVMDVDAKYALAKAHHDAKIVVFTSCTSPKKELDETYLTLILAHEIGHELGIWDHVPASCDGKDGPVRTAPDDTQICGRAVMNPHLAVGLTALTVYDAEAFDQRDREDTPIGRMHEGPEGAKTHRLRIDRPPMEAAP